MEDPSLLEIQDITPRGSFRARGVPDVQGGAEHPTEAPGAPPRPKGAGRSGRCGASDGAPEGPSAPENLQTFGAVRNTQRRLTPSGKGQHDEGSLGATPTPEGEYRGFPGANGGCPGKEIPGGPAPWDQFAPGVSEGTRSLS